MLNSSYRHDSTTPTLPSHLAFLSSSSTMERTSIACATPVISLQKLKNFLTQPRFRFPHHGKFPKEPYFPPNRDRFSDVPKKKMQK
ncbi:zinc finger protein rotund [Caerostris darwini]|uniref:Zinc finger protein rotund n=1 Tax=Caerostris darwini TaxID=1538125 RepID=A0AAV4RWZ8_9ARAC|nr:zinc finger protein rotund [Caerostris darwini]